MGVDTKLLLNYRITDSDESCQKRENWAGQGSIVKFRTCLSVSFLVQVFLVEYMRRLTAREGSARALPPSVLRRFSRDRFRRYCRQLFHVKDKSLYYTIVSFEISEKCQCFFFLRTVASNEWICIFRKLFQNP